MAALTITRTAVDGRAATLTITNAKGESCTGRFYSDGSGKASEGTVRIYQDAPRMYGARRVKSAIQTAVADGSATLEAI